MGKADWHDLQRFERHIRTSPFAIVSSKNTNHLSSLLEAFKKVGTMGARGLSTLIVDDEADQASLNTYTSKRGGEISAINNLITDFRNFFQTNTYLQVTATPQALFLQKPDGLYRPSFTVLSEPGPGYIGGEHFFEAKSKLLRYVELEEVDQLRSSHQPSPTSEIPKGLRQAFLSFLIGATVKNIEYPTENFAFLCHISHTRIDHKHLVSVIDAFREEAINAFKNHESSAFKRLKDDLFAAYQDIAKTESGLPDFKRTLDRIGFLLPAANIKEISSASKAAITLDHIYSIFVGGNKLGRGVTIPNLITSYYGRNPKRPNSDTVLQHARMYGYREKHVGVTRLFLPEKLAEHFRIIHQMEKALRDLVRKHPKGKFEGIYISSPLQATRRNVLDPNSIGLYVAGRSYNPAYPLRLESVRKNTEWIDGNLSDFNDKAKGEETTIDFLIELLEKCRPDPKYEIELWDQKTLIVALEKLKSLRGSKAYIVVRRGRDLREPRRETQGILSGGEESLAPKDAPTLFMYRQNEIPGKKEIAVWWPQLRFPEGNYALAFSFNR